MRLILTDQRSVFYRLGEIINESGDTLKHIKDYLYANNKYYLFLIEQELYRLYTPQMYGVKFAPDEVICPPKMAFRFSQVKGKEEMINVLKQYASGEDIEAIIHAGRPDTMGESGIRIALGMLNIKKPIYRIWTCQLNREYLKGQLENPEKAEKYDHLASAGYAERYINWLWSTNITQKVSEPLLQNGIQIKCMRMLPLLLDVLAKEADKSQEIIYYVQSDQVYEDSLAMLTFPLTFDSSQYEAAEAVAAELNHDGIQLVEIEKNTKIVPRPYLYTFDELQYDLGRKYGFVPEYTMILLRNLYDNGWISYPYSSAMVLNESEKKSVEKLLREIKDNGYNVFYDENSQIFEASETERISGIYPVGRIPTKQEFFEFSDDLKRCYNRIILRFCAVFAKQDCEVEEICYDFHSRTHKPICMYMRGVKVIQDGFREFDPEIYVQKIPDLQTGVILNDMFHTVKRKKGFSKSVCGLTNIVQQIHIILTIDSDCGKYDLVNKEGSHMLKHMLNALCVLLNRGFIALDEQDYYLTEKGQLLYEVFKKYETLTFLQAEKLMLKSVLSVEQGKTTTVNAVREVYQFLEKEFKK